MYGVLSGWYGAAADFFLPGGSGDAHNRTPPHRSFHLPIVLRTGGIMNPTIELLVVSLCWLGVFGGIATIIAIAIG